jgi:hypothetical protein
MRKVTYPLLTSQDQLTLSTLAIPTIFRLAGNSEAAKPNARVDNTSLEDVRVCTSENTRHHGTRG